MTSKIFKPLKIASLVSEMKWALYARNEYWIGFFMLLVLMGAFLTEVFLLHYTEVNERTKLIAGNLLHTLIVTLLVSFIKTELRQMSFSIRDYLYSWDNYIDMLFILSMSCYSVANFALQFDNTLVVRMFGAIALIFSWIKVISYLRAFSGFAFIMLMLISVFKDMKYFLLIMLWILLGFSFSCTFYVITFLQSWDAPIKGSGADLKHISYDKNFA